MNFWGKRDSSQFRGTEVSCQETVQVQMKVGKWEQERINCIASISRETVLLPISEVPALVYQLLVLSTKGHKQLVLSGIRALFIHFDEQVSTADKGPNE